MPVGAPGRGIGAGDGGELQALGKVDLRSRRRKAARAHGGAGGGDVLKGGGGGQAGGRLQLLDQLPGVEGVQKVDVAGLAVEAPVMGSSLPSSMKMRAGFWLGLQPYFSSSSFAMFHPSFLITGSC